MFLVFNGSKYLFLLFFPLFSVPGREGFIINFTFHCLSFSTSIVSVTFLINILRFFILFSLLLAFVNRLSSRLNFHSSSHERIHLFTRSFFEKVFTRREFTIPKNGTSFLGGIHQGEEGGRSGNKVPDRWELPVFLTNMGGGRESLVKTMVKKKIG